VAQVPRLCAVRLSWSLALSLVSGLLGAQESVEPPIHFGLQATFAQPRQDLRDITGRKGLGGGFFFEEDLDKGWSVRARFDYLNFREDAGRTQQLLPGLVATQPLKVAADQASIGAETRLHPKELSGLFFLGEAFGTRVEFQTLAPGATPQDPPVRTKEKTSFKFGLAGGLGYQVTSGCALTLRYTTANLSGVTLGALEGGLGYRF